MSQRIDFADQVVVVTGAGAGLGRAYAIELGRRGAAVVVNDIGSTVTGAGADPGAAERVVQEIEAVGGRAIASTESVADESGGAAIVMRALDTFGRLDAVIANAGILRSAPLELWTAQDVRDMCETHILGAFNVAKPAFSAMRKAGYGRFVFVSSGAAMYGNELQTGYSAAKGGVVGLMKAFGLEGRPFGIHANAVCPVAITRMASKRETLTPAAQLAAEAAVSADTDAISDAERRINEVVAPLRPRMGADYVVPFVAYLASREVDVNMAVFTAAAGRYARLNIAFDDGWHASFDAAPTAEDIADHFGEIDRPTQLQQPGSQADELSTIAEAAL